MNLNQDLVKQGWCWWYRRYAPGDTVLEGLEKSARESKKGLWADPQPVPPWEWRKRKEPISIGEELPTGLYPQNLQEFLPSSPSAEHLRKVSPAENYLSLA